jgi:Homeodomain-like domain
MHDYKRTRERREREKIETLMRFRTFAKRSTWKKARISRELGVSLSTVDRWLDGHDKIMLASMLEIQRFLEEREQPDLSGSPEQA